MSYIGSTPTTQSFIAGTDYFNGTGSAVNFTMSRSVNSVNDIEVIVNNVEQIPSGYSVSGTTLTFSAAPSAGTSNVYVRYLSTTNLSLAIPAGTSATFNTVTVADGSATTPSITNDGDTNTGIFFPAADTIAFAEGGAEAMRIDSSGNVGIGITSPTRKLAVSGTWTNTGDYLMDSDSPQLAWTSGDLRFKYAGLSGTEAMRINSSGNVGIGTSSPGATLDVAGNARSNAWIGRANGSAPTADAAIYRAADNTLAFSTANTERARITTDGSLFLNTTSTPTGNLTGIGGIGALVTTGDAINVKHTVSGNTIVNLWQTGTSNAIAISFAKGNSQTAVGTIAITTSSTAYNTSSDYRLKEDIQPMTGALAKVAALKPCTYKWKVDGSDGQGFIAHELDEVVSGCVTGEKDAVDADGNPQYQGIDTSFLVATLTAAIQEQQALITALTTRITALENNNATQ